MVINVNGIDYTVNNVYYISPDGNDTTGDGSKENPYFSLGGVYNGCPASSAICVLDGEYTYDASNNYGGLSKSYVGITSNGFWRV